MSFKYFVIGSGSIGRRHFDNLFSLGANVTHHPWRGIDLDQVLCDVASCNGNVGVVIATATNVRLPLITKMAAVGAALYIEKPVAYRTSEVAEIFELPKLTLQRSVAGFMMRYHPIVQRLLSTPMNDVFRAYIEVGHDVTQWRQNWIFERSYSADPDGGGVLLDLCHEIDLAYLLFGVMPLTAVTSIQYKNLNGVDIISTVDFGSEDGRSIRVTMDYLAPKLIRRGHIVGLTQEVNYDIANNWLKHRYQDVVSTEKFSINRNKMFLSLMHDFMAIVEGRQITNKHAPRLDKVENVCRLIAKAWEAREFTGQMKAKPT